MGSVYRIPHYFGGFTVILSINSVPYGSTAKIMLGISEVLNEEGIENMVSSGYSYHPIEMPENYIKIGSALDKSLHIFLSRITGLHGCFSYFSTLNLLRKIKKMGIDTIHLHNLHGWYINLPLLFKFIKKNNIKVIWTLHDCWAFTGHCPHFDMVGCEKWKEQCKNCSQYKSYPKTFFDGSKKMFTLKKRWFLGLSDLTIVTPSNWLAEQVKQSFLKDYPIKVINNGIDLSVFKPQKSDFRQKYSLQDKKIILGVSFGWDKRKGIDVFISLAKRLPDDYRIVLVGTNEKFDNILSIGVTQNADELAGIYSAADLFVNPTREETLGNVNIEALACGTPVLTFNTGGSPEIIDESCGAVVEKYDVDGLLNKIIEITKEKPYSSENCTRRAEEFEQKKKFKEYLEIYKKG